MKRLLLFLDGTWNTERGDKPITNVVRLREFVDYERSGEIPGGEAQVSHRVYYDEGVGTGLLKLDQLLGGALGLGLEGNIREAYRFVSQMYEPGDEIFVFGFSRGAFTARSLVGYIAASGVLRRDACSPDRERAAWLYYRTPPKQRFPADRAALDPYVHSDLKVKCLGVFDTVGALGIPFTVLGAFNAWRYQFHDTALGSIVENAFHALAVDEPRWPFRPSVWTRPPHNRFKVVEQVWFPGAHSDIGGGNVYNGERNRDQPLSSVPLEWIISRVEATSDLRFADRQWVPDPLAPQHEAFGSAYKAFGRTLRTINKIKPSKAGTLRVASIPEHLSPIGELIHSSVLERLGHQVQMNGNTITYRPLNVVEILDCIQGTYSAAGGSGEPRPAMKVVGNGGHVLNPETPEDVTVALKLLQEAQSRLGLQSG